MWNDLKKSIFMKKIPETALNRNLLFVKKNIKTVKAFLVV